MGGMDQFWAFAGHYWWLIFPLIGVASGAAKGWERAARNRHRRRLELIAARQGALPPQVATASEPQPITRPSPLPTQLERLFAQHDAVTARWLDYELDVAKLIAFPSISDGRQPLTAAFLRAKKVADSRRPASVNTRITQEEVTEYRDAVTEYEVAFDLAEREARRLKDADFSAAERKRLATAKQLLTVAVDEAATSAERHVAYRRVREEIDGLLAVSDEAIQILEKKVALELPPGA